MTNQKPNALTELVPNPPGGVRASALLSAIRNAGATHVVTVPDLVQLALHDLLSKPDSPIKQVYACSEDQALTTATGLYVGGTKPLVLVQNQGFYKCMNTLRATCIDAGVPIVFLVGQFGREAENIGRPTRESSRSVVRLMEPVLDAVGLPYWHLADDADLGAVAKAFDHAYTAKTGAALLVDRYLTWN